MRTRRSLLTGPLAVGGAVMLAATLTACGPETPEIEVPGGDPEQGRTLVVQYGCTSCHSIPNVPSVDDESVAPALDDLADRDFLAGQIPNRTEELIAWLQNPQLVDPGTLMPDMGVTRGDAEDIAAFLYGQ
ncbi:c-type cytochrome [Microbacterium sp. LRZ72]|uniref:c-type cytochrome n=1 Tax=Microbacterium sp. LRZ72 TaxID=2942481 RepID=UPI0029B1F211|nr:c-type cytochrome [Microbacterium sp. LRZ72]MDX2377258.1 c-type cytochrome [Microbacterium sp. LRZ72]